MAQFQTIPTLAALPDVSGTFTSGTVPTSNGSGFTPVAHLPLAGGTLTGGLTGTTANFAGNVFLGGNSANVSGSVPSSLANSGQLLVAWNRSSGRGEVDLISNRGAGAIGGFRLYDYTNAGSTNLLLDLAGDGTATLTPTSTGGGISVVSTASPLNSVGNGTAALQFGFAQSAGNYSTVAVANDGVVRLSGAASGGNLILAALNNTGGVKFVTGATESVKVFVTNSGRTLFGTTTDNGTDVAQFNGSISATGTARLGSVNTSTTPGTADGQLARRSTDNKLIRWDATGATWTLIG